MGYTRSTIRGISWMSASRFVTRAFAFFKIIVFARVLSPLQFGVFGIATLILSLLETLTETGINIVLIQSKADIREYINSAWVVSIIRGVLIAFLIIISSPIIAAFFRTPQAMGLLLFISLVPFVRGFINPAEVTFQKELNFHLQFWFQSGLFFIDAFVSITLVLFTHSITSLVWGMLISAVVEVVLSFAFIKPTPRFAIEKDYFTEIFHKGIWITGYTTFNYFAENLDNAVVGRVLGATALGYYQMAYKLSILPVTEVCNVISSVVFPVFAKIVNDNHRLQNAFFKTIGVVLLGSLFLGSIIFFFPVQIVTLFLGSRWVIIVHVLKILIIYSVISTAAGPTSALFLSLEKQKYVTVSVIIRFLGLAITIYFLVNKLGLVGAGYSQVIAVVIEIPVLIFFCYKIIRNFKTGK